MTGSTIDRITLGMVAALCFLLAAPILNAQAGGTASAEKSTVLERARFFGQRGISGGKSGVWILRT